MSIKNTRFLFLSVVAPILLLFLILPVFASSTYIEIIPVDVNGSLIENIKVGPDGEFSVILKIDGPQLYGGNGTSDSGDFFRGFVFYDKNKFDFVSYTAVDDAGILSEDSSVLTPIDFAVGSSYDPLLKVKKLGDISSYEFGSYQPDINFFSFGPAYNSDASDTQPNPCTETYRTNKPSDIPSLRVEGEVFGAGLSNYNCVGYVVAKGFDSGVVGDPFPGTSAPFTGNDAVIYGKVTLKAKDTLTESSSESLILVPSTSGYDVEEVAESHDVDPPYVPYEQKFSVNLGRDRNSRKLGIFARHNVTAEYSLLEVTTDGRGKASGTITLPVSGVWTITVYSHKTRTNVDFSIPIPPSIRETALTVNIDAEVPDIESGGLSLERVGTQYSDFRVKVAFDEVVENVDTEDFQFANGTIAQVEAFDSSFTTATGDSTTDSTSISGQFFYVTVSPTTKIEGTFVFKLIEDSSDIITDEVGNDFVKDTGVSKADELSVDVNTNHAVNNLSFEGGIEIDSVYYTNLDSIAFTSQTTPNFTAYLYRVGNDETAVPTASRFATGQADANGELTFSTVAFSREGEYDIYGSTISNPQQPTTESDREKVLDLIIDRTTPTLTINVVSNNDNVSYAKVGDVITLTVTSNEILSTEPAVVISEDSITKDLTSAGNVYVYKYTVPELSQEGITPFTISGATDRAGNVVASASLATDGTSVTIDRTSPVITLVKGGGSDIIAVASDTAQTTLKYVITTRALSGAIWACSLSAGEYAATYNSATPPSDANQICFEAIDIAGNASYANSKNALDGVANLTVLDEISGSVVNYLRYTNNRTPIFVATTAPNTDAKLYRVIANEDVNTDGVLIAEATSSGTGSLRFSTTSAGSFNDDGTYDIYGSIILSGIETTKIKVFDIAIDTIAPAAPDRPGFSSTFSASHEDHSKNNRHFDTRNQIAVSCGLPINLSADSGYSAKAYDNGAELSSGVSLISFNGYCSTTDTILAVHVSAIHIEGVHNIQTSIIDPAGNESQLSVAYVFTVDTIDPAQTGIPFTKAGTTKNLSFTVSDVNPLQIGSVNINSIFTKEVVVAEGASSGEQNVDPTITVSDLAGNSISLKIRVDNEAPTVTIREQFNVSNKRKPYLEITISRNQISAFATFEEILTPVFTGSCSGFSVVERRYTSTSNDSADYTITVSSPRAKTYADCALKFVDGAGNESAEVTIDSFRIASSGGGGGIAGSSRSIFAPTLRPTSSIGETDLHTQADATEIVPVVEVVIPSGATGVSRKTTFSRPLKAGDRGEDVRDLQKFLNAQGFTVSDAGAGSAGRETNYFGPATASALKEYQEAHSDEILEPLGLEDGTGLLGEATIRNIESKTLPTAEEVEQPAVSNVNQIMTIRDLVNNLIEKVNILRGINADSAVSSSRVGLDGRRIVDESPAPVALDELEGKVETLLNRFNSIVKELAQRAAPVQQSPLVTSREEYTEIEEVTPAAVESYEEYIAGDVPSLINPNDLRDEVTEQPIERDEKRYILVNPKRSTSAVEHPSFSLEDVVDRTTEEAVEYSNTKNALPLFSSPRAQTTTVTTPTDTAVTPTQSDNRVYPTSTPNAVTEQKTVNEVGFSIDDLSDDTAHDYDLPEGEISLPKSKTTLPTRVNTNTPKETTIERERTRNRNDDIARPMPSAAVKEVGFSLDDLSDDTEYDYEVPEEESSLPGYGNPYAQTDTSTRNIETTPRDNKRYNLPILDGSRDVIEEPSFGSDLVDRSGDEYDNPAPANSLLPSTSRPYSYDRLDMSRDTNSQREGDAFIMESSRGRDWLSEPDVYREEDADREIYRTPIPYN